MKRLVGNILLLIISTIVSLVAAEFTIRLVSPQNLSGSWKEESKSGGYWVNRDRGESFQQFEHRVVRYHFGKHHLRIGSTRSEASHKILVLGESFTFGSLLSWEDTYVGRLQQAADRELGPNKIELLNAAVNGWGLADYVAYYEDYGNELDARTVLVFLNTDDVGRSVRSGIYAISEESGSIQRQPPSRPNGARLKSFMNAFPFYEFAIERSHLLQLMRTVVFLGIRPDAAPAELSSQWENALVIPRSIPDAASVDSSTRMAKALFRHLFGLARDRDHKVIVLTTGWHKFGHPNPAEPTAAFMRIADSFFKENGIYFFDLSDEVYRQSHGTLAKIIIERDFHPNESGARLISDVAWAAVSECFHSLVGTSTGPPVCAQAPRDAE